MFGTTTEMPPGQTLTVSMNFVQDENQRTPGPPSKIFQVATEIVVGIAPTGTKRVYSLYNLIFDQVAYINPSTTVL